MHANVNNYLWFSYCHRMYSKTIGKVLGKYISETSTHRHVHRVSVCVKCEEA